MNAAAAAAENRRLWKIVRSSIGAGWWRSITTNAGSNTAAAIRPPITSGSPQPEMPPLEIPSTSPVRPIRNVIVPAKSNLRVLGAAAELAQHQPRPGAAGERERDVEPEHPVPRDRDQRAAEHRADHQADRGDHRVGAHRQAELLARERVGDDRGRVGEQERAADPLEDPPQDQLRAVGGEPGAERRQREHARTRRCTPSCARTGQTAARRSAPARSRRSCRRGSPTPARAGSCAGCARGPGSAMISVPELIVASSIPRLVHDSAHHL